MAISSKSRKEWEKNGPPILIHPLRTQKQRERMPWRPFEGLAQKLVTGFANICYIMGFFYGLYVVFTVISTIIKTIYQWVSSL